MNRKKIMFPLFSTCLCLFVSLPNLVLGGEDGDVSRAIEYRESLMTIFQWNMKPMGAMMKGKMPYDPTQFQRHAKDLSAAAKLDLLAGFPEDSVSDDSDALPDIWLDFEGFKQKYQDLKMAADALEMATQGGDKAAIQSAFGDLGKSCKSCHRAFKD
jgi:cytochrome c556